jgi:hypothetical protein
MFRKSPSCSLLASVVIKVSGEIKMSKSFSQCSAGVFKCKQRTKKAEWWIKSLIPPFFDSKRSRGKGNKFSGALQRAFPGYTALSELYSTAEFLSSNYL